MDPFSYIEWISMNLEIELLFSFIIHTSIYDIIETHNLNYWSA